MYNVKLAKYIRKKVDGFGWSVGHQFTHASDPSMTLDVTVVHVLIFESVNH